MNALDELIQSLSRLPGLGKKSAKRIAYHLLQSDESLSARIADQIVHLKSRIHFCKVCGNFTEDDLCPICKDPRRDKTLVCVVEQAQDIQTIEASQEFNGLYHVLHGVLSPLDGVGPEKLNLANLFDRIQNQNITELILATNPTLEGDTTALYIKHLVNSQNILLSRLALGMPIGGDLEYTDRLTVARSLKGRTRL